MNKLLLESYLPVNCRVDYDEQKAAFDLWAIKGLANIRKSVLDGDLTEMDGRLVEAVARFAFQGGAFWANQEVIDLIESKKKRGEK